MKLGRERNFDALNRILTGVRLLSYGTQRVCTILLLSSPCGLELNCHVGCALICVWLYPMPKVNPWNHAYRHLQKNKLSNLNLNLPKLLSGFIYSFGPTNSSTLDNVFVEKDRKPVTRAELNSAYSDREAFK